MHVICGLVKWKEFINPLSNVNKLIFDLGYRRTLNLQASCHTLKCVYKSAKRLVIVFDGGNSELHPK